jgi:Ca2+-binding EF-hand superfamily protein
MIKRTLCAVAACAAAAAIVFGQPGVAAAQASARVAEAFKKMDANGDGVITLDEWTKAGRKEAGFRRVDADGDGKITIQELQAALAKMRSR